MKSSIPMVVRHTNKIQMMAMAALVAGAVLAPLGAQAQQRRGHATLHVTICTRDARPSVSRPRARRGVRQTHPPRRRDHLRPRRHALYQVGDKPPVTLKAGDVLFVPADTPHSARYPGSVTGSELATYIVEKGKPLLTLVKSRLRPTEQESQHYRLSRWRSPPVSDGGTPCILPLLPVLLGASFGQQDRWRPLFLVTGFTIAFSGFAILFGFVLACWDCLPRHVAQGFRHPTRQFCILLLWPRPTSGSWRGRAAMPSFAAASSPARNRSCGRPRSFPRRWGRSGTLRRAGARLHSYPDRYAKSGARRPDADHLCDRRRHPNPADCLWRTIRDSIAGSRATPGPARSFGAGVCSSRWPSTRNMTRSRCLAFGSLSKPSTGIMTMRKAPSASSSSRSFGFLPCAFRHIGSAKRRNDADNTSARPEFSGISRMAEFAAADNGRPPRQSRTGSILDLLLHQLSAHVALVTRWHEQYKDKGLVWSACTRPNSPSRRNTRMSKPPSSAWASIIRWRRTISIAPGEPLEISTGRPLSDRQVRRSSRRSSAKVATSKWKTPSRASSASARPSRKRQTRT